MNKVLRMFIGEPMPDKNDPKYREKYERDVAAGRKFAQRLHLDKGVVYIQTFANNHTKLFLVIVFGFVTACFARNVFLLTKSMEKQETNVSAIDRQDRMLQQKLSKKRKAVKPHTNTAIEKKAESDTIKLQMSMEKNSSYQLQ